VPKLRQALPDQFSGGYHGRHRPEEDPCLERRFAHFCSLSSQPLRAGRRAVAVARAAARWRRDQFRPASEGRAATARRREGGLPQNERPISWNVRGAQGDLDRGAVGRGADGAPGPSGVDARPDRRGRPDRRRARGRRAERRSGDGHRRLETLTASPARRRPQRHREADLRRLGARRLHVYGTTCDGTVRVNEFSTERPGSATDSRRALQRRVSSTKSAVKSSSTARRGNERRRACDDSRDDARAGRRSTSSAQRLRGREAGRPGVSAGSPEPRRRKLRDATASSSIRPATARRRTPSSNTTRRRLPRPRRLAPATSAPGRPRHGRQQRRLHGDGRAAREPRMSRLRRRLAMPQWRTFGLRPDLRLILRIGSSGKSRHRLSGQTRGFGLAQARKAQNENPTASSKAAPRLRRPRRGAGEGSRGPTRAHASTD